MIKSKLQLYLCMDMVEPITLKIYGQSSKKCYKGCVTAYVLSNGEVQFSGKISKKSKNPIIKILFEDNKNGDIMQNAQNIKNVLTK